MTHKGMMIQAILNYLEDKTKQFNKDVLKNNGYHLQREFDRGDMFFTLAFMDDNHINFIAKKILG